MEQPSTKGKEQAKTHPNSIAPVFVKPSGVVALGLREP